VEQLTEQIQRNEATKTREENCVLQVQSLKHQAEEKERQMTEDFAGKLAVKSKEVMTMKEQVARQLADMEKLKKQWQAAKELELSTAAEQHRREIEALKAEQEEKVTKLKQLMFCGTCQFTSRLILASVRGCYVSANICLWS
jgi:hypothetical protein